MFLKLNCFNVKKKKMDKILVEKNYLGRKFAIFLTSWNDNCKIVYKGILTESCLEEDHLWIING